MNNFFVLNEAIDILDRNVLENGLKDLILIKGEAEPSDNIIANNSIWNLESLNSLYILGSGQNINAIIKFIEQG